MVLAKCGTIALLSFLIAHFVCVWIGTLPTGMFGYMTYFALWPFQIESVGGNFVAILQLVNLVVASPGTDFGSDNILFDYPRILLWLWQGVVTTICGASALLLVGDASKTFNATNAVFLLLRLLCRVRCFQENI
jgi:hypothetical protein